MYTFCIGTVYTAATRINEISTTLYVGFDESTEHLLSSFVDQQMKQVTDKSPNFCPISETAK